MSTPSTSSPPSLSYSKRKRVEHGGRVVYEWEQELDEVNVYIPTPPDLPSKALSVVIAPRRLTVGIRGNPAYLDEELGGEVVVGDSYWTLEDAWLHLQLQKAAVGSTWKEATVGPHAPLSAVEAEREQQRLLLERFQREHPGFDFSQANVSGTVPDVAQYMGGIDRRALR